MSDKRRIFYSLCLNITSVIIEITTGLFTGSLSILADAAHNFTDSLIMISTLFGLQQGEKPATDKQTFGFGRTSVLLTLFNAVLTILLALFIFYEAYQRFLHPVPIQSLAVAVSAFVVMLLNGSIAYLSSKGKDISTKMVFLPNLADTASAFSIMVGSILLAINPNLKFIDPLLATIIGVVLISSVVKILREVTSILMENVPNGINLQEVTSFIKSQDMVRNAHDLHAWTVSSNIHALSAHVEINNCTLEVSNKISNELKKKLKEKFCLDHTTLEMECQHTEEFAGSKM